MSKRRINNTPFENFINNITNVLQKNTETNEYTAEEIENMIKELLYTVDNAQTILDVMKNKPKAFSTIKYNDLVKMNDTMNWKLPEDLFDINIFNPKLIRIPDSILKNISNELSIKTNTIGILSKTENEDKRKKFIDIFIESCINIFKGEITNDIESYINDLRFQGKIEYILKSFSEIIIVVIEAKKDIEYQSNYGQIISELYNSYCYNNNLNLSTENVYGILTTGINWQWWKYDGKEFYASESIQLIRRNKKSLPIIASYIYSIVIDAWIQSCKIYFNKYKNINNKWMDIFNNSKNIIFNANSNEEAEKAFKEFNNNIDNFRKELGHSDYIWDYDLNYI